MTQRRLGKMWPWVARGEDSFVFPGDFASARIQLRAQDVGVPPDDDAVQWGLAGTAGKRAELEGGRGCSLTTSKRKHGGMRAKR